jgi:hypothetical protein
MRISSNLIESMTADSEQSPSQKLMKKELTLTIYEAISSLKISYRNVIALRCFEQLSYAEIAGITGGTQIQAKLQFFRAKKALARRLKKKNFKQSHLLPALGLFAALTAKSVKASSISLSLNAATLEIGRATYIIGMALSRVGLVVGICIVITLGGTLKQNDIGIRPNTSNQSDVLTHIMKDIDYAYPVSISQNSDIDENSWQSVIYLNRQRRIESVRPEEVLTHDQTLPGKYLILPANNWVQAEFGNSIVDEPGVDLFVTGNGLTNKPQVSLVDSNEELQELVPTLIKDQPTGFTIIAFDLANVDLSSKPSSVRVTALSSEAGGRPFELRMVRTRIIQNE